MFTDYPDRFKDVITEFLDTSYIKTLIQQFDEEGSIEKEETVRSLDLHLTAVGHYEEQDEPHKVVNHVEGFKDLLDYQHSNEWIIDEVFDSLVLQADLLMEKWQ
ncbi:FIMAH domain-containing protein [Salicibibacter kimchii]|uniref:FIMAH domain-containing protein n=1 Tax=Salicibibacter kimchii TaxID=2099786 RepID=A0A345BY98_9BACI|nr:hypothetical protein [Salicibibacter kimchii]AXF55929.1 hypothetical protein DT065_07755 [Salicibibacter kimchii]